MSSPKPARWLVLFALITVQVLFGMNYVISKVVVGAFPPLVWASIRIIISSFVMLSAVLASGRPHPKGGWSYFGPLIPFALLATIINQASFLVGLKYTTSTNSAILTTLMPVVTLLLVTLRGQEPATLKKATGFFFALAGVLIVRKVENFSLSDKTLYGDLLTILNALCYGVFLSFSKKFFEKHDALWTTTWLFIYGSVGLTLLAVPDYLHFQPPAMDSKLWAACAFAVVGATLMPYFLNFWALRYAKSSHVALFIYIQPVIASLIAWGWMGEEITVRTILASGLIFFGVVLAMSKAAEAIPARTATVTDLRVPADRAEVDPAQATKVRATRR